VGRELGLPEEFLERHPYPGPGLAIRCLCAEAPAKPSRLGDGWFIPVHSVGVQGDCRTYRPILAICGSDLHRRATELINERTDISRVVAEVSALAPISEMQVREAGLTPERLERLRKADAAVRRLSEESRFEARVWQFPVILIPFGTTEAPDSIVLRPVDSVDGMTAQSVEIPPELLDDMAREILAIPGIAAVFSDLTHKPPGTIEWE
jgi:GMP synthase (glutamine-hydrolysing)